MTRPADSVSRLAILLGVVGLLSLLVITVASPGGTRMYAWPWSIAYHLALLVPALLLLGRSFDSNQPLILPPRAWTALATTFAAVVLASALFSPFRAPALLWSAPLLGGVAVFFLAFDWLNTGPSATRRDQLLKRAGLFLAVVALVSVALWLSGISGRPLGEIWAMRNPFPLGHANYTAGLALLMLPLFSALAVREPGPRRIGWLVATVLALVMLLTSGSRGGLVGFIVLVIVHVPALARALRWKLGWVILIGVLAVVAVLAGNPRTRTLLSGASGRATLRMSDVQRSAMVEAGVRMGRDRPLLGWGPGTTPLAYPTYREDLDGGVENVLQLHRTPVQLWAELGAGGLLAGLVLVGLALLATRTSPAARSVVLAASGYAVFCLTDWQLDIPVFGFAVAVAAALVAPHEAARDAGRRLALGGAVIVAVLVIALVGRRDPTPEMNVRALTLARDPAHADAAISLLNESLRLNPAQEIAHFNLGWLLVVRDPALADHHFLLAADFVPDKGGVYFGQGLARLNQGLHGPVALGPLALECINDPVFLTSPWWNSPALRDSRAAVNSLALELLAFPAANPQLFDPGVVREAAYVSALIRWLNGRDQPGEILASANTPERVAFFARPSAPPDFATSPARVYRRERTGYPVLMRRPDLPAPLDLFDVQENVLATGKYRFLFPTKGWLPSIRLLRLTGAPAPSKP